MSVILKCMSSGPPSEVQHTVSSECCGTPLIWQFSVFIMALLVAKGHVSLLIIACLCSALALVLLWLPKTSAYGLRGLRELG